jgi:hypothetical protein
MKLEKFALFALEKGVKFTDTIHGTCRSTYHELAKLTESLDFGCKFDKFGRCRNYKTAKTDEPVMCCCNNCFNSLGYLHTLPTGGWSADSEDRLRPLKVYARHFSEKTVKTNNFTRKVGFWRPGKGCVLPRIYRSPTCLTYTCGFDKLTKGRWLLFKLINGHVKYPIEIGNKGLKYDEFAVVDALKKWHKELDDKNNSK